LLDFIHILHNTYKQMPTKKLVSKSTKLSSNLKPSSSGLRRSPADAAVTFTNLLPQMMELQADLIPFSTSCDLLGVKPDDYGEWVARFPAIALELKRARAIALVDLQKRITAGGNGWQALCRIGELADPANWIKAAPGRPQQETSPFSQHAKRKRQ
jgi:hypothetical protein